jgi:hypothetical protein
MGVLRRTVLFLWRRPPRAQVHWRGIDRSGRCAL